MITVIGQIAIKIYWYQISNFLRN